jgi:hypothetical protein
MRAASKKSRGRKKISWLGELKAFRLHVHTNAVDGGKMPKKIYMCKKKLARSIDTVVEYVERLTANQIIL